MQLKNNDFSHHWTESASEVLEFLEICFGATPERVSMSYSGDVRIGEKTVEIKSCQEWVVQTRVAGSKRRRGRFAFEGHEKADYVLFVLVGEKLRFKLEKAEGYLGKPRRVSYASVFDLDTKAQV